MENKKYDAAIIGCGLSGANIARRLSQYAVKIAILEKEQDVSFGVSKANSGIIHGGFHHNKKYLKTQLEIQGNALFDQLKQELDFPFKRCGIIVAALQKDEMKTLEQLFQQGMENGAPGIELCSRERILSLEPKLSPQAVGGLYAPNGGITEPYRFVFALVESAVKNGADLYTNFSVQKAQLINGFWQIQASDNRQIAAQYVVNAAGLFADEVSALFGGEKFSIKARKGEYFLLDKQTKAKPKRIVFPAPTPISKGMLVIPTAEGTVLIGPTADDTDDKKDRATSAKQLEQILEAGKTMIPELNPADVITAFAGLRPYLGEDFYIEPSKTAPRFIQVAGIQSPGLTASPAIGEYVKNLLKEMGLTLPKKPEWNPFVPPRPRARECSPEELDQLIALDPAWGNIVCRCEKVSEAEILQALQLGHSTLDGIKYFTRAQMGRCQGGFCSYKIIKIILRETGLSYQEITKQGGKSYILPAAL
ncbi:MAG: NAD(P)/FAD-dependent oxidoreductase [Spirochaetaceae bacterium]|jgi:glycerol-3-phosphate dehydrogenase|nr:NAD(P)/FAD-dependent oxidoreductase [Spirochaetaceae bacterium]